MSRRLQCLILLPTLLFMLAPLLIVFVNSFNESAWNAWPPPGLTLNWYRTALDHAGFLAGLKRSVMIALVTTAIVFAIGIPAAYAISRRRFHGRKLLHSLLLGPLIVPRVALGFGLFLLFVTTDSGLFGTIAGIVIAHVIMVIPFVVTIFLGVLGDVDPALEEAARDLGASPLGAFFKATLPQMRVALLSAGFFAFITSFDEVETTLFIVQPAINTLPVEMYNYLEYQQDPTIAALSSLLILASLALGIVAVVLTGGRFWTHLASK